jgi:hypothetical protein
MAVYQFGWIFQQDGAPCHTSHVALDWLEESVYLICNTVSHTPWIAEEGDRLMQRYLAIGPSWKLLDTRWESRNANQL